MVKFFRPKKYTRKGSRSVARRSGAKKVVRSSFRQKVLSVIKKNAEKKHFTYSNTSSPLTVGQVNGLNNEGYFILDMSPAINYGGNENQRVGNEIDLTSASLRLQFYQMSATYQNVRLKYMLVACKGAKQLTQGEFAVYFLSPNPFNGIRDYNSSRNPESFNQFQVLRTGYCNLPTDPASVTAQTTIKEARLGLKLRKPLRIKYSNGTTVPTQNQLFMIIMADSGNNSTTTASTINVPVKEVNTGVNFNYVMDYYYTDV